MGVSRPSQLRNSKRGKHKKAALADTSITVEDARLILNAYFAHLAAQSSKLQADGFEIVEQGSDGRSPL